MKVLLLIWIAFILITHLKTQNVKKNPNILFLISDDMRPDIGVYKPEEKFYTPNLDNLAGRSILFKNAYVQQALCSPSRTSFLTSRRPDTTRIYKFHEYFRDTGGDFTTIPQFFKEKGYFTKGLGKIFHPNDSSNWDDPISWNQPYFHASNWHFYHFINFSWKAVSDLERAERPLPDDQIAEKAIETLREIAPKARSGEQPFFLAVGFHKPHLPFVFPESFLDLHPMEDVHLPSNPYIPKNFPEIAWHCCSKLASTADIARTGATLEFGKGMPDEQTLKLRRAYYSCISYIDFLIGNILQELDVQGLKDNTIVSFIGDHGWQLGEHNEWCKQTNFDLATKAPMMIHVPGLTDQGLVTDHIVEFLDLFPTLVETARFDPLPHCSLFSNDEKLCTEGKSLMPIIKKYEDHFYKGMYPLYKDIAYSQYPKYEYGRLYVMGYTVKTKNARYTEWIKFTHNTPLWDQVVATELYDHLVDPDENNNVADNWMYVYQARELSAILRDQGKSRSSVLFM